MNNIDRGAFIYAFSYFSKISVKRIEDYLKKHDIKTLIERPETIKPTPKQLENINTIKELERIFNRLFKLRNYQFDNTKDLSDFFRSHFDKMWSQEQVLAGYFDDDMKLLGIKEIFRGAISSSVAEPKEILKQAIVYDSSKIILAHNHPSGDPEPSEADFKTTENMMFASKALDILLVDHLIIGRDNYFSFAEHGTISQEQLKERNNINHKTHEKIYKKDEKEIINLINKTTKIPKKAITQALENNANLICNLFKYPQLHFKQEKQIKAIEALNDLYKNYKIAEKETNHQLLGSNSTFSYLANNHYDREQYELVLFINTKNEVIDYKYLPLQAKEKEKVKVALEYAVLNSSRAVIFADKNIYKTTTPFGVPEKVNERSNLFEKFGMQMIDYINIEGNEQYSFLGDIKSRNKNELEDRIGNLREKHVEKKMKDESKKYNQIR